MNIIGTDWKPDVYNSGTYGAFTANSIGLGRRSIPLYNDNRRNYDSNYTGKPNDSLNPEALRNTDCCNT